MTQPAKVIQSRIKHITSANINITKDSSQLAQQKRFIVSCCLWHLKLTFMGVLQKDQNYVTFGCKWSRTEFTGNLTVCEIQ
jgi:hypothetical protein